MGCFNWTRGDKKDNLLVEDEDDIPPMPPFSSLKAVKGGILIKRSSKYKNSWNKRLFVLEGQYLYYFKTEKDRQPRGVLTLQGAVVQAEEELGESRKAYVFSVYTPKSWNVTQDKKYLDRTYYFSSEDFQEMSDWMSIISKAADYYI